MLLKYLELTLFVLGSIAQAQSGSNQFSSFQDALASNGSLSQIASLIQPYVSSIDGSNFTLFAPNNAALGAFLNSSAAAQFSTDDSLRALISYHTFGLLLSEVPLNFNRTTSRQTSLKSWLNETFFLQTRLLPDYYSSYTNVTGGQLIELNPGSNGDVSINSGLLTNSRVLSDAITFDGGEIYIIDRVFTIPPPFDEVAIAFGLSSMLGVVRLLGLTSTYQFETYAQLNVFAPTNAAFSAVAGNLAALSADQLGALIQYHAFPPPAGDDTVQVTSLLGPNYTYSYADNNTIFVNNARLLAGNIFTKNGNIWIIDQVLNPDNTTVINRTSCDDGLVAFANPSASIAPPYTTGIPSPTSSINTALATESLYSSASTYCPARPKTSSTNGSTVPGSSSTGQPSAPNSHSKTNIGAIVGGVVGGIGGLLLILLLFWCCKRRGYSLSLNRRPQQEELAQQDHNHDRKKDEPIIILNPRAEMSADEKQRVELANEERRRLAEMTSDEKRLNELSTTSISARNAVPSELEGHHHDWTNNSPQQYQRLPHDTHTQTHKPPNIHTQVHAIKESSPNTSGSGSGFDSTSTQHYPSSSSAAGTEGSITQSLMAAVAAPAAPHHHHLLTCLPRWRSCVDTSKIKHKHMGKRKDRHRSLRDGNLYARHQRNSSDRRLPHQCEKVHKRRRIIAMCARHGYRVSGSHRWRA